MMKWVRVGRNFADRIREIEPTGNIRIFGFRPYLFVRLWRLVIRVLDSCFRRSQLATRLLSSVRHA